ncbi:MAG: hypothetical protein R3E98_13100 [Gemmatimonadota bacterium]
MPPTLTVRALSLILLLAAPAALAARQAEDPDVDELVRRHVEARGGAAAIAAIRTLVYRNGRYREPGFEGNGRSTMSFMRPYYRVVGDPDRPGAYLEGYDGSAWEWYADPGVVVRTVGAAAGAARRGADFEGRLVDYRAKGSTVVLGEPSVIDGRPAHRLTLTTRDGFRRDYFLDAETALIVAERYVAPVHAFGAPVRSEVRVGDYRRVAGVLFAFRFREVDLETGALLNEMQWGDVEANVDLPLERFTPPGFERTPMQRFLEGLYAERADEDAVLWTYAEFRRAHPDMDTEPGVAFIGYQMQKMGDTGVAVRLLEANARDHPESSPAAFALGRAYASHGMTLAARRELERALALDPGNERAREALAALPTPDA